VENLAPPGFEPWIAQPIVSRHTDNAIPACLIYHYTINLRFEAHIHSVLTPERDNSEIQKRKSLLLVMQTEE
jgi:hypothetical protein